MFNPLAVRVYISRVEERINEPSSASKVNRRANPERNREVYRSDEVDRGVVNDDSPRLTIR